MRIVVAPDSFKESLTAMQAAQALAEGLACNLPHARFELIPIADGGEGTVAALVDATAGRIVHRTVTGPLGHPLSAAFGMLGDGRTAVIEIAAAAGLALVPPSRRNPFDTTTHGCGELIRHALDEGARRVVVGLGGSASNDGGSGMLQALGVAFLGADGRPLTGLMSGGRLHEIHGIDLSRCDPRLREVRFEAAGDVDNPLLGPHGASAIFGPQKGATPAQIAVLDAGLARFYAIAARQGLPAVVEQRGAGAAGGLGAALLTFFAARLAPGVELVLEAVDLPRRVVGAALVVTGEGRIDAQTLHGKAPAGVARAAATAGVPVIAVGGTLADQEEVLASGLFSALEAAVYRPCTMAEALRDAPDNLRLAGQRVARWLSLNLAHPVQGERP